jgi:hypothetical protein
MYPTLDSGTRSLEFETVPVDASAGPSQIDWSSLPAGLDIGRNKSWVVPGFPDFARSEEEGAGALGALMRKTKRSSVGINRAIEHASYIDWHVEI